MFVLSGLYVGFIYHHVRRWWISYVHSCKKNISRLSYFCIILCYIKRTYFVKLFSYKLANTRLPLEKMVAFFVPMSQRLLSWHIFKLPSLTNIFVSNLNCINKLQSVLSLHTQRLEYFFGIISLTELNRRYILSLNLFLNNNLLSFYDSSYVYNTRWMCKKH